MRNLKKILALVLALIMSLSLMATAGATDFKDDENVGDVYRQAVEVLSDLGVFNGDQNGNFNPEKPITRAEVAAIIYRIATGDVNNERNDSYAPYNQFPDIMEGDWYAGYVTYCANAGYVKGRNTGNFDPKDQVTGYEVLAMILRAVGYDKNNEFVGSNWQTNTASLATQKGVLKNITSATSLGAPATRETVAELLFRSILLPQVNWNSATLSYDANRETLAKENLNMEQVEGVVVANEWADLRYDYIDVDADQTVLETANGERTLAVGTDLTDIGESRYAYVQNGSKVLGKLEDTGLNTVKDCVDLDPQGKGTSVGALAGNLSLANAEYYVNFGDVPADTSEYRIEYSVSFRTAAALEWFETRYLGRTATNGVTFAKLVADDNAAAERKTTDVEYLNTSGDFYENANGVKDPNNVTGLTFSRIIPASDKITALDVAIMKGIFASAASFDSDHKDFSALSADVIHAGYVYAGTKTNPNTSDRKDDLSDGHTYQWFEENYINTDPTAYFTNTTNGVWLKVIDNDSNGKADYVLATIYDLVEVDSYNDRTGVYTFSNGYDSDDAACRDGEYEFAVGDMLLGAPIDGTYVIEESKSEIVTIEKYSWKDLSVTTKDGAVLYESGTDIDNDTGYADRIEDMAYGVEYEVFYDHYGFIRAYRPIDSERKYGLLTDLYLTDQRNTHYIDNQIATVELSFLDENGKLDMDEYDVFGHSKTNPNVFVGINQKDANGGINDTDNLQRAMAHLGMTYVNGNIAPVWSVPTVNTATGKYAHTSTTLGDEFDYDGDDRSNGQKWSDTAASGTVTTGTPVYTTVTTDTQIDFSWTNVARYSINEDGTVNLNTVSEYAYNRAGVQLYYWDGTKADFGANDISVSVNVANAGIGGTRATAADWRTAYAESHKLSESVKADKDQIDAALKLAVLGGNLVPVYAVDYVMLEKTAINKNYHFAIDNSYNDGYNLVNNYVNAVKDTVFYIVTPTQVYPVVGYDNLPAIAKENIHAMYAVAQNIEQDRYASDYWVADVIVIETNAELGSVYSYMIYNYYDNYRQGNRAVIHELEAIDCRTGELITVVVDSAWTQPYDNGFYLLTGAEVAEDGSITATGMVTVESRFIDANNKQISTYGNYGIYSGEVIRSNEIENRASYIDVFDEYTDSDDDYDTIRVLIGTAPWYSVYGTSAAEAAKSAGRFYADKLSARDYAGTTPNGHEVIYVTYNNVVRFIIDTSFEGAYRVTPYYLNDDVRLWANEKDGPDGIDSVYEKALVWQTVGSQPSTGKYDYTVKIVAAEGSALNTTKTEYKVTSGEDVSILKSAVNVAPDGWESNSFKIQVGDGAEMDLAAAKTAGLVVEEGNYLIFKNVKQNITITVTNSAKTASLKWHNDSAGTGASAVLTHNGISSNAITLTKNVATTEAGYVSGDTFKMTVTGLDSNANTYEVTVNGTKTTNVTWTNSNTAVITGTLAAETTVKLTATLKDTTAVNVKVSNATVKFTTKNPSGNDIAGITSNTNIDVLPDQDIVFSVTAAEDHTIKSVKVTQTGSEIPVTTDGKGTYTIAKAYNNGTTTVITVETVSTGDITVTVDDQTSGNKLYVTGGEEDEETAGDYLLPYTGGTLTIKADAPINVTVDDDTKATLTHSADYYTWTVKATDDVTVTVEDRANIEEDVGVNKNPGGPEDMAGQTGTSYSQAYASAGITVTTDAEGNATITVSKSEFAAFMRDYQNETTMAEILTLRPWDGTSYTNNFLAAGVIFTAPAEANSVKITEAFPAENLSGGPDNVAKAATGQRGVFDANGVHTYVRFTNDNSAAWNASNAPEGANEYVGSGISAINQTRVEVITMEFYASNDCSGTPIGTVTRTVTLQFVD